MGPYSQAIKAGNLVFISGCIPLDPATKQVVPGEVEEQAKQALANLKAVVEASGSSTDKVAKTTVCSEIIPSSSWAYRICIQKKTAGVPPEHGPFRSYQHDLRRFLWLAQTRPILRRSSQTSSWSSIRDRGDCCRRIVARFG